MDDYILFYPESDRFPDLTLRHCGYEECVPGHSYGPAVRSVYLIHIIIRGHGTFMANQQTFRLGEGDGFLIVPEMQTYYRADDNRFFSVLLDDIEVRIGTHTSRNRIVGEAVHYIEECYSDPSIRVAEIAKRVNVERGYLYTLFMKNLGLSPQEYLLRFRLTKATDLLNHTDLSIDKITVECGYQDTATFSKAFRKMFGIPPGKFRKEIRERMRTGMEPPDIVIRTNPDLPGS